MRGAVRVALLIGALGMGAMWPSAASAATYTVNVPGDPVPPPNLNSVCNDVMVLDCSLRTAILKANLGGNHTVSIPAGIYELSRTGAESPSTLDLNLLADMTLQGAGAGSTIIQAGPSKGTGIDRVLSVEFPATVTIQDLTLRYGSTTGSGGGLRVGVLAGVNLARVTVEENQAALGGGIANSGNVDIRASLVAGNSTGGIGSGGGITVLSADASTLIFDSTISGNASLSGGGIFQAVDASLQLNDVTIANNTAEAAGEGGGIRRINGSISVVRSLVVGNRRGASLADCSGTITSLGHNLSSDTSCGFNGTQTGDAQGLDPLVTRLDDHGGPTRTHALLFGSPAIDTAGNGCSATDQRGVSRPVDGNQDGSAACDKGAFEARVLVVDTTADNASLTACTTASGDCSLRGAVRNVNSAVTRTGDTIVVPANTYRLTGAAEDDQANSGDLDIRESVQIVGAGVGSTIIEAGASSATGVDRVLHVLNNAELRLSGVTVRHGRAPGVGGGLHVENGSSARIANTWITANEAESGGGINVSGDLIMASSTVSQNRAGNGTGGGLRHGGFPGSLDLRNVTISANTADLGGAGYEQVFNIDASMNNVTITGNHSEDTVPTNDAGVRRVVGTITATNTIIAHNTNAAGPRDCADALTSGGFNLSSDSTCGFSATSDQQNVSAMFGPLQSNGGPTPTHALLFGSPAIDSGSPGAPGTAAACEPRDQRGVARPLDGNNTPPSRCDKGAYEAPNPCNPRVPVTLSTQMIGGNLLRVTITAGVGVFSAINVGVPTTVSNGRVDIQGGPTNITSSQNYNPPPNTFIQVLDVRQQAFGQATTVPLQVTDFCGQWTTFVGGGTSAWTTPPGNGPSPAPAIAPSTTAVALVPGAACASFATHAAAQAHLRANPTDPLLLDRNRNGIACEGADGAGFVNPPLDQEPVKRP